MFITDTDTIFEFNWPTEGFGATLYCILTRINYCINEKMYFAMNNSLSIGKWTDYFEPFWDEAEKEAMYRRAKNIKKIDPRLPIYRTHRLGRKSSNRVNLYNQGKLSEYLEKVYKINKKTQEEINKLRESLNLPEDYTAIHIRRGDRTTSRKCPTGMSVTEYLPHLKSKNIYVATDSYKTIEELKELGDFNIYHLCKPTDLGHTQKNFNTAENKHQNVIQLLTEIDIAATSSYFVGAYCSVLSHLMQIQCGLEKSILIHKE